VVPENSIKIMKYFVDRKDIVIFKSNCTRFAVGKIVEGFLDNNAERLRMEAADIQWVSVAVTEALTSATRCSGQCLFVETTCGSV
jgi:hypothetical protein